MSCGLQAAQAAHAAFEFARQHRAIADRWMDESNFIVLVTVPDEERMIDLVISGARAGLAMTLNFEPDVGNTLTAVVFEPGAAAKRLCQKLPLLGGDAVVT